MSNNVNVLEVKIPAVLNVTTTLEQLPLDNYRVDANIITEEVEKKLLQNPNLLGLFVMENYQVIGVMSRRQFFEQLSKPYSRALYSLRPIKVMVKNHKDKLLRISLDTTIIEAVKSALTRSAKYFYEPIVLVKNSQEVGMLELSTLILAQSQMLSGINDKLTEQEKELRNYAETIEQEKLKVKQYAEKLEIQQFELKQRNDLLQIQRDKLKNRTEELSAKTTHTWGVKQQIVQLSLLLSKESKKTFSALYKSINALTLSNQKIKNIGDIFLTNIALIDEATNAVNEMNKMIKNLSFQASLMTIHLATDKEKGKHFAVISDEIKQMSILNSEAHLTINKIAKELKPQIKLLVNTSSENQEVISSLLENAENTQSIVDKLSSVTHKEEDNLLEMINVFKSQKYN